MENTIKLINLAYVKNFKCDGQRCGAICCRGWKININAETFKKYEKIESAEKEITSHINFVEDEQIYRIKLDDKKSCPFLTAENLCGIQKKYGEKFLSLICNSYPGNVLNISNIFECSLSLTCPLVAELALTSDNAISTELYEIPTPEDAPPSPTQKIPINVQPYFYLIQISSMVILKQKKLSIDQRLAVLGFFWRDIDKIIKAGNLNKIEPLAKNYMSPNFFEEYGAKIFADVKFNHQKFLEVMIDGVIKNFFMPLTDDENILLETAKVNFSVWERKRAEFIAKVDTILSNYIAHEIFQNLYPYRVEGSVAKNFAVLVVTYKVMEMNIFLKNFKKVELRNIINSISENSRGLDNDDGNLKIISSAIEGEEDITEIISTFLPI